MVFETLAIVGSWIATPIIFFAYLPGSIKAIKTRQTIGIGLIAFSILAAALFCLSTFGWLRLVDAALNNGNLIETIAFAIFQTGSFLFTLSILAIKIWNLLKAKKLGITEEIYCKNLQKTQELKIKKR